MEVVAFVVSEVSCWRFAWYCEGGALAAMLFNGFSQGFVSHGLLWHCSDVQLIAPTYARLLVDVVFGVRVQRLLVIRLVLRMRIIGCEGVWCFPTSPSVPTVSTSPSGGNQVDGSPPATSYFSCMWMIFVEIPYLFFQKRETFSLFDMWTSRFIWLVEKVPRRVIVLAPVVVLLQTWAGHRCRVGTLQSSIARDKTDGFLIRVRYVVYLLIAEPPGDARSLRNVCSMNWGAVEVSVEVPCLQAVFKSLRNSFTSRNSLLLRWYGDCFGCSHAVLRRSCHRSKWHTLPHPDVSRRSERGGDL